MLKETVINPLNNEIMVGFDWTTQFDTENKKTVQNYIQLSQLAGLYKRITSNRKSLQYILFKKKLPKVNNIELLKKQINQLMDIRKVLRANGLLMLIEY